MIHNKTNLIKNSRARTLQVNYGNKTITYIQGFFGQHYSGEKENVKEHINLFPAFIHVHYFLLTKKIILEM